MKMTDYIKQRKEKEKNGMLRNYGLRVSEVDEGERIVDAVISTDTIDRMKEVLLPRGAILDNFKKNPVVPWGHDSSEPPVGKALKINRGRNAITARIKFATTQRAEEVWQLFKGGFLRAFSVGFRPIKGHEPTPEEIKRKPAWAEAQYIYDKWELLEFSPVTIPANPEALAVAIKNKELLLSDEIKNDLEIDLVEREFDDELEMEIEEIDEPDDDELKQIALDEDDDNISDSESNPPMYKVEPLDSIVNPQIEAEAFFDVAELMDVQPLWRTNNFDVEEFVEADEFVDALPIIDAQPCIDVTEMVSKENEAKRIRELAEEDKRRRLGIVWYVPD